MFKYIKSFFSSNNSTEFTLITKVYMDHLQSSVQDSIKIEGSLRGQVIDLEYEARTLESKVRKLELDLLKSQVENLKLKVQINDEEIKVLCKNIKELQLS